MTTTKKLMTAALAVAALATASIAASGDAMRAAAWRRTAAASAAASTAAAKSSIGGRHFGHRWHGHRHFRFGGYGYALQHLLEVHAVRPRERLPGAVLSSALTFGRRPARGMARAGFRLGCRAIRFRGVLLGPPCAIFASPQRRDSHGETGPPFPTICCSVLPPDLAAALFAAARPHRLKADQTLFAAGDPGDGCYRVEQGLLKVSVVSPVGRRAHSGDPRPRHAGRRARDDRRAAALGLGHGGARFGIELHQPRRVRAGRRARIRTSIATSSSCWCSACATPTMSSPR